MGIGRFVDVSGKAIVSLAGRESLDLLQRISTNDVIKLVAGGAVQTVLTNEKGRIVELISVLHGGEGGLLLVGEGNDSLALKQWIEKFIIMEDIKVEASSHLFNTFLVYDSIQSTLDSIPAILTSECRTYREMRTSSPMAHILVPSMLGQSVKMALLAAGFEQVTKDEFEGFRILQRIPGFPGELLASYNPLEAGLAQLVSFTKGCYVGQEVIARLDTYKKIQRRLVRLSLEEMPDELPEKLYSEGREWGSITSAVRLGLPQEFRGLGYVKVDEGAKQNELYYLKGTERVKVSIDPRDLLAES